jgi:hypothetical protein
MKHRDAAISEFHALYMKPAKYKKIGQTFSRNHAQYSEHYNIQGSAWNSEDSEWRFYVNCGISFHSIPVSSPGTGMWKFHAHTRLRLLIPEAPSEFSLSAHTKAKVFGDLFTYIGLCSEYFSARNQVLKESYLMNRYRSGFPEDSKRK